LGVARVSERYFDTLPNSETKYLAKRLYVQDNWGKGGVLEL